MTQALLPCRFCGGSPNALTFANEYIQGELRMWVCENNERFGGSCPNGNGYLSPDFWNEAMRAKEQSHSQATPETGWQESERQLRDVIRQAADALQDLGFPSQADEFRQMSKAIPGAER